MIMGIALLLRVLLPVVSTVAVRNQGVFLFPDSRGYIKPAEELSCHFASQSEATVKLLKQNETLLKNLAKLKDLSFTRALPKGKNRITGLTF